LKRAALKLHYLSSIACSALGKDADRVEASASILDFNLTSHDCFDNLVTLFLRAAPVDENALETLAEHADKGQVFDFDLWCVSWVQGTEN
jgi:hypothetical protein